MRPDAFALGSGLRWTIDQMGPEVASEVKQEILDTLSARRIERVATNVIYAVAQEGSARPNRMLRAYDLDSPDRFQLTLFSLVTISY